MKVTQRSPNDPSDGSEKRRGQGTEVDPPMKGWKWAQDPRVLVCIIAALIFTIWVALQQKYY
jgi:hypothetical protein